MPQRLAQILWDCFAVIGVMSSASTLLIVLLLVRESFINRKQPESEAPSDMSPLPASTDSPDESSH
jgi:hypothetical protein